jgi:hypothetical protein
MKYDVTIQATIIKTYTVEADNEDEAYQLANERFELIEELNVSETYQQDTIEIQPTETEEA